MARKPDIITITIKKMTEALLIIQKYNKLHNDLEAYLFEIADWGLGKRDKPNPKHYNMDEN